MGGQEGEKSVEDGMIRRPGRRGPRQAGTFPGFAEEAEQGRVSI